MFLLAPPQEGREQYELAATSEQGGKKPKPKGKKEKDKDMDELKKEVDLVSQFSILKYLLANISVVFDEMVKCSFMHCCRTITNCPWMNSIGSMALI